MAYEQYQCFGKYTTEWTIKMQHVWLFQCNVILECNDLAKEQRTVKYIRQIFNGWHVEFIKVQFEYWLSSIQNSKKLFRFHFLYPFRLSVKRESSVVIIAGCLLRICSLILSCRSILSWATWLMIHSQSDEDLLSTQSLIYPPQYTMTNFHGNPISLYPTVLTGLRKTLATQ